MKLCLQSENPSGFPEGFSACQKSLAEFRARRRESGQIVFSEDMCLGKNTSQPANVRKTRQRRVLSCAAAGCNSFVKKGLCPFLTEQNPSGYTGAHKKVIAEITIMASVRRGW